MTKLKIGSYVYKYSEEPNVGDNNLLGLCSYPGLEIKIRENLKGTVKKVTIMHELIHSFYMSVGYRFDNDRDMENTVDIAANSMVDFINKNKKFFKENFLD